MRGEGEEARSHMQPPQHLRNKTAPNASRLDRRFVGVKGACSAGERGCNMRR